MKIIKENIRNPGVIEIGRTYSGDTGSIKIKSIYIDISNKNNPTCLIDYDWENVNKKKGTTKMATISNIISYFEN